MKPAKMSVDILVAHQCLHDHDVLAIYITVAALDYALKNNLDVISSSLRDQESWTTSLMLPVHVVKGPSSEDSLRGLSHCLDLILQMNFLLAWAQLFSPLDTVVQSSSDTQQPPDR